MSDSNEHSGRSEPKADAPPQWRAAAAEFIGTFLLVTVAAGTDAVAGLTGKLSTPARAAAPGLLVLALIYSIADASGAHFNPSVTLAFVARGVFPAKRVIPYWVAQFAGAVSASLLLHALFGAAAAHGVTSPHGDAQRGYFMETLLTFILITVILGVSERHRLVGPNAALAVGATILLCGIFGQPISGASMNPARSLGPALVEGQMSDVGIYLFGPATGALLAVVVAALLHGRPKTAAPQAAQGDRSSE